MGKLLIFLFSFQANAGLYCEIKSLAPRPLEDTFLQLTQARKPISNESNKNKVDHALAACFRQVASALDSESMPYFKNYIYLHHTDEVYRIPADAKLNKSPTPKSSTDICTVIFDPKKGCSARGSDKIFNTLEKDPLSKSDFFKCKSLAATDACQFIEPQSPPIPKEEAEDYLISRIEIAINDLLKHIENPANTPLREAVLCTCGDVHQEKVEVLVRKLRKASPPSDCDTKI